MPKYTETTTNNISLANHIHVDNGGTSLRLVEYNVDKQGPHLSGVEISDSYHGYSESKITLHAICDKPDNLRKIAKFFMEAADLLDKKRAEDKTKY
jgi:hypothetical protein